MIDILKEIDAIRREVRRAGTGDAETVTVVMRRSYPTGAEDVWDAITTPKRIARWFAPVTGDLVQGGSFQVEGNASGQILKCDRPHLLRMTYNDVASIVEVRLIPAGSETTLEVEHTVPITMARSGAGALFVGPGWDGGFLALALHLRGEGPDDPVAAARSLERQRFSLKSAQAWAGTVTASDTATQEEIDVGMAMAHGHFAPDVE